MDKGGLGIAILPELILRRIPYRIVAKQFVVPAYRESGIALRSQERASLEVMKYGFERLKCP